VKASDDSPSKATTLRRRRAHSLTFSWLEATRSVLLIGVSNSYICVCEVPRKGFGISISLMKIFQKV
jgi:hypothetical protein